MRKTAKTTLVTGFGFSITATLLLSRYGTSYETVTGTLYLYGFVCLAGGVIGYRHAFLRYCRNRSNADIWEVLGVKKLFQAFKTNQWFVKTVSVSRKAKKLEINQKLVSLRDEKGIGISYPRKAVVEIRPA